MKQGASKSGGPASQPRKRGRRMARPDRRPLSQHSDRSDPSRLLDCPEELAALECIKELRAPGQRPPS
jgi:hypothetical protein